MAQNEETKLEFGMSLHPDIGGFKEEWKKKESEIQRIINESKFTLNVSNIEGLDKFKSTLKDLSKINLKITPVSASGSRNIKDDLMPLDSIKALKSELRNLETVWTSMSDTQKYFVENGRRNMTPFARELISEYERVSDVLRRFGLTLKDVEKKSESYQANMKKVAAAKIGETPFELIKMREYYSQLEVSSAKAAADLAKERAEKDALNKTWAETIILQKQAAEARDRDYASLKKQIAAEAELAETQRWSSEMQNYGTKSFELEKMAEYYRIQERTSAEAAEREQESLRQIAEERQRIRESAERMAEEEINNINHVNKVRAEAVLMQQQMVDMKDKEYASLKKQLAAEAELAEKQYLLNVRRNAWQSVGEKDFALEKMAEYYRRLEESSAKAAADEAELNRLIEEEQRKKKEAFDLDVRRGEARFKESTRIQAEKAKELQQIDEEYEALKKQLQLESQLANKELQRKNNDSYKSFAKKAAEGLRIQKILKGQENSLERINEKLAIQRKRLEGAALGSSKYKKISQEIQRLEEKLRQLNGTTVESTRVVNAQTNAYKRQSGVLNGMKQFINSYVSLLGAYRLVGGIKQITSEFELQRVSLRAITQDMEFADQLFAKIKMTAVESPFSTKELVTYTKQLSAYRIENEELYDTMQMLADVSAGLGVGMDRLILAYGQVKAASVLRGTELRQFTEAGIPLVDLLSRKFSQLNNEFVSTSEVFDLISRRKVPFEMVAEIFHDMTKEGGSFFQMQKKQSESLYGVFENLTDAIQNSFDQIGKSNRGLLMGMGKMLTKLSNNLQGILDVLEPLVYSFGVYRVSMIAAGIGTKKLAADTAILTVAEKALKAAQDGNNISNKEWTRLVRIAIATNNKYALTLLKSAKASNVFTKAILRMEAFLIKNPMTAALTAATAVIAGTQVAYNKYIKGLSSAENAHKRFAATVESIEKPIKETEKKYSDLVSRFKEQDTLLNTQSKSWSEFSKIWPDLADKYKDQEGREKAIANAMNERKKVLNELKSTFPGYFENLDAEKVKVEDLSNAYIALADDIRKEKKEGYEADKQRIESEIRRNEELIRTEQRYGRGNGVALDIQQLRATNKGLASELESVVNKINEISKAEVVAGNAALYWRKKFNELLKGESLNEEELAAIDFSKSVKETRDTWKDAKENLKQYSDALVQLEAVPNPNDDVTGQIEDFKKLSEEQKKAIRGAEEYARIFGFALEESKKSGDNNKDRLAALRTEMTLVEDVYKRYLKLSAVKDDPAAKKTVSDMFSGLLAKSKMAFSAGEVANIFEQIADEVEGLGDKDFAVKIRMKAEDFRIDGIIRQINKMMDEVKEQIDRQSASTDFFEKIVGLTGNEELATKLTLSITGINVEDGDMRSLLADQIAKAVAIGGIETYVPAKFVLDGEVDIDSLSRAIEEGEVDIEQLNEMVDKISNKEVQEKVRGALSQFVDYNKEMVSNLFETLSKFGKFTDQEKMLTQVAEQQKKRLEETIRPSNMDPTEWANYVQAAKDAVEEKLQQDIAALKFDEIRKKYADTLKHMETSTYKSLDVVKKELSDLAAKGKLSASDLSALLDLIKRLEDAQIDSDPIQSFKDAIEELKVAYSKNDEDGIRGGWKKMTDSAGAAEKAVQTFADSISGLINESVALAESLGVTISPETQDAIDGFNEGMKVSLGILGMITSALVLVDITGKSLQTTLWPLLAITLALGTAFAIFKVLSNLNTRKAEKEIERLTEKIEGTEKALRKLEFAEKTLLGSDWVKNQLEQVDALYSKSKDLAAQAEAEKSKGKKEDKEKTQDYLDKSLEAEREALTKHREMVEEMAGTSLVDAAKEFADSWIDAYVSFDDTMGALKESFKDMMRSLVANSVFARVVQKKLEPVFEAIDNAISDDGELSVSEWDHINEMGQKIIESLDVDLTRLGELYRLRDTLGQGPDNGDLHGIAKGITQASEETVLTLAGYANSILYYQIAMKNDISTIRAILEGRVSASQEGDASNNTLNVGQLIAIQQASIAELKAINSNTLRSADSLDRIEDKIDSVISPVGMKSRKVINTRL